MIAQIRGVVASKDDEAVVLDVGGIGVEVIPSRPAAELCQVGQEAALLTRLIVREDSLTLFGFAETGERDLFDILIKISGIGPKLGITVLRSLSLGNLRNAVANERIEILTRVPGIGKKTAQKMMLELRDKLPTGLDAVPSGGFEDLNADVMDALVALGFSVVEAQTAVQSLPADAPEETDARLAMALQYMDSG